MEAVDMYKMVLRKDVIKIFPKGFWQRPEAERNAIKCTKFLIEKILKWNNKDIKEKLSTKIFKDNSLVGML